MRTWQNRELVTKLFFQGKSLRAMGFPHEWEYDPLLCIWNSRQTYTSMRNLELAEQVPFCLSDRTLREMV